MIYTFLKSLICLFLCFYGFVCIGQVSKNKEIKKAILLYEKGDFEKSKEIFQKLISLDVDLKSSEKIQVLNNLGNIYADQGKNTQSLKYYQKALVLSRVNQDKLDESKILKNIGALYLSWKKFDSAEDYYFKALVIAKSSNDQKLIADCYNNLGTVYEQLIEFEKAEKAYLKALDIYQKKHLLADVAMVYSNLAIVYKLKGNIEESIHYNVKALEIAKKEKDTWLVAAISNNVGNAYTELKDFDHAFFYCNQGLKLADSIKAIEISVMALESLANMYEKKGDFKLSSEYYKRMISKNNEFINQTQTRQFSEMEIKFKTKEKELENKRLRMEKTQYRHKTFLLIGLISLLFLILFAIYFTYTYVNRQKILNQKQREMNEAIISSENKERFRIARDLHDSVGQMLSALKMQMPQEKQDDKLVNLLDQTILEVRQISHNLIPEALNFGLKRALEDLFEKSFQNGDIYFELDQNYDSKMLKINKEKQLMILRIIQELVGNTLKHSEASRLELKIEIVQEKIQILFSENGKGFDLKKIVNSAGLGWKNIDARLSFIKGNMNIDSVSGKGTTIKIKVSNE